MSEETKLDKIADGMIENSNGSFDISRPAEWEALNSQDQETVMDKVLEEVDACGCCGWYWHRDSMDNHENWDGALCYKCMDDAINDAEEEGECQGCSGLHYVTELSREGLCDDCEAHEEELENDD